MSDPSDSPELSTVIRGAIDARMVDVHTAMPGRVESYDKDAQTADVRPQFKRVMRRANGERVAEELPVIPCVPVQWPRGGGFAMTMPLAVGDFGMLILQEYSIDRWRSQGEQVDPADERRHGLSGAVFVPGIFPTADALGDAADTGDGVRLGKDDGYFIEVTDGETRLPNDASDLLARDDRVETELQTIVDAIKGGVPGSMDGGAALQTSIVLLLTDPVGSVGSDTVKGT